MDMSDPPTFLKLRENHGLSAARIYGIVTEGSGNARGRKDPGNVTRGSIRLTKDFPRRTAGKVDVDCQVM